MISTTLTILFAASLAFVLIEVLKWQDYDDYFHNNKPFDRKPFNCIPCLSGWIGIVTAFLVGFGWFAIMFLPICMVAGIALDGLLKKL